MERLQKVLSSCGVASRRASEKLILERRVRVNGVIVTELGTKVNPQKDIILVDGKRIVAPKKVYYLFNKPKGVISTVTDPQGRRTVLSYFEKEKERLYPIGRLDQYTEGLLLLTNDGELANILMHPSHEVEKTYEVKVKGRVSDPVLETLATGVPLEDGMTAPATVTYQEYDRKTDISHITITIHEGRNRQVRRMVEHFGFRVHNLKRSQYAGLSLKGVKRGAYRQLTREEVQELYLYR